MDRTCAELTDGDSWRHLLGPLVEHDDAVLGLLLGDKRSMPPRSDRRRPSGAADLEQGTPAWRTLNGVDARALFTGVAAHTISQMPSLVSAGAGLMLATLAHTVGWPIPVGGSQAIPDALIADLRAHGGELVLRRGDHRTPCRCGAFRHRAHRAAVHLPRPVPARYAKALRATDSVPAWRRSTSCCRARFHGRDPRLAMRRPCTWAEPASRWPRRAGGRRGPPRRNGRWCSPPCRTWPTRAASTHRAAARCGRTRMCRRARPSTRARPSQGFSSVSRPASATSWWRSGRTRRAAGRPQRQSRRRRHRRRRQHPVRSAGRADAAAQPVEHADSQGVPVLVGDAAWRRRARNVRLLCRAHGAAPRVRHQEAA